MAENIENNGCSQRDNAEHEGYVKASRSFNRIWKERDSAQPRLLEAMLWSFHFATIFSQADTNIFFRIIASERFHISEVFLLRCTEG